MADAKAISVPLSERPYCIGTGELMGFVGAPDKRALRRDFLSKGLHWDRKIGKYEYYYKESILAWLDAHTEHWTEGTYLQDQLERKKRFMKKPQK